MNINAAIAAWFRKLTPQHKVAATGALVALLLTSLIFAPGGILDGLTSSSTEEQIAGAGEQNLEDLLPTENPTESALPAELSKEKNAEFLVANAKKEGVTVTSSGLHYRVLSPGKGKQPGPTSKVTVHYTGKLINGKEFDSSEGGDPISFPLNRVIPGWTEGLQLMKEGETAELVIPQDLGYGSEGSSGAIPPYQTLVFEVELIKVQ